MTKDFLGYLLTFCNLQFPTLDPSPHRCPAARDCRTNAPGKNGMFAADQASTVAVSGRDVPQLEPTAALAYQLASCVKIRPSPKIV
jgi:hypothetical protein